MKYILIAFGLLMFTPAKSYAYAAQQDAEYVATLKAVVNYKINDEENLRNIEKLRQDRRFNEKLQRMLNKLSNDRTKDGKNREVLKILEQAGKDIYNILN